MYICTQAQILTLHFEAENCSNAFKKLLVDRPGLNLHNKSKNKKTSSLNKYWECLSTLPGQNPSSNTSQLHASQNSITSSSSYRPINTILNLKIIYSEPSVIQTSFICTLDYPEWNLENF